MTTYQQVALQNKDVLAQAGYAVDANGNVTYGPQLIAEWAKTDPSSAQRLQQAGYISPAEWSTSLPDAVKQQYGIQPSNPTSAIAPKNTLFDNSHGLFTDSTWDKNSGTFKSGIDWPMLLTTAGVAGAAGAAAIPTIAGSGGGAAAAAPASAGPLATGETGIAATTAATVPPAAIAAPSASAAASLPDWLKTAQDVGQALGAASSGRAAGRNADNTANIGFAQAQNSLYNSELAAPQKIASNAVRGDILSSAKDVSLAAPADIPVPTISGGLRPSMFSPTTRALGSSITANAAATPMPTPTPPVLQPMETAGPVDSILNTAGYLGNLAKPTYDIWKMFNG